MNVDLWVWTAVYVYGRAGLLCGMQPEYDVSLHYPICYWLAKAGNGC